MYFSNPALAGYLAESGVIVFDMNGLIVDDEPVQLQATNAALRKEGYDTQLSERQWVDWCVGRKPREWLPLVLQHAAPDEEAILRIMGSKDAIYAEMIGFEARGIVRAGFYELIESIKKQSGKKLAVATSTTRGGMEIILGERNLNVLHLFDYAVCGDQVAQAKPDPEIYLKVKAHFGENLRYLVFEDSSPGIISAAGAGMTCIAVPNRFTIFQDLSMAAAVIDNMLPFARPVLEPSCSTEPKKCAT